MTFELALELKKAGFDVTKEIPSCLSQLIEACGERFDSLTRSHLGTWRALARYGTKNYRGDLCDTPEEAVARLWLALQKT